MAGLLVFIALCIILWVGFEIIYQKQTGRCLLKDAMRDLRFLITGGKCNDTKKNNK